MVLRCSLLGHDYGETDVEREREERGSEVVVTVQEYEECIRCGERNVISENTEITSLSMETAASRPTESDPEPNTTATADAAETVETPPDEAADSGDGDDAEFIDADAADTEFIDDSKVGSAESADIAFDGDDEDDDFDVPTDENGEPVTDDGEILDDSESQPDRDREHGEWPESEDVGPPVGAADEPTAWPDDDSDPDDVDAAATEADRTDAEVTDDAIVLEDDTGAAPGESAAATEARTLTTEPPTADSSDDERTETPVESDAGSGIERAGSAPVPGESTADQSDVPTELYCPRCEYVAAGARTSLRTGDICPDCRKGYLGKRERR
ncbi:DUF7093 family protein [Natronorubrum aibiense]|uniref:Uncharacterized protein n=1 Tax=Natronorubrum aibiense TaxID=348826 RepID=A0A5P9P3T1_9EURY|nr:hypothetical protein [Natronorubrum aibiense]QFU82490.1 hypothetical protein GCU68_08130 [Natronorubrum aibiense]